MWLRWAVAMQCFVIKTVTNIMITSPLYGVSRLITKDLKTKIQINIKMSKDLGLKCLTEIGSHDLSAKDAPKINVLSLILLTTVHLKKCTNRMASLSQLRIKQDT